MHVFREAMQIEHIYPFFGFICFLKGHDLHSGSPSLLMQLSEKCKTLWGENCIPGSGFWEILSAAPIIITRGGAPQHPWPQPNAWRGMDYLPFRDSTGDLLNALCILACKCSRQTCRGISSCVLQQRSTGIESGSPNVNPTSCKEEIRGSIGTKRLFNSFQLLQLFKNRERVLAALALGNTLGRCL